MSSDGIEHSEVAVLGAGPIGVEAALYARRTGREVRLYERGRPGAHVEKWGHVEFFSSWELNRSDWGCETLEEAGVPLEPDDAYPTGREYLERYLRPLVDSEPLAGVVTANCEVVELSRRGALKTERPGAAARVEHPFLLRLDEGRAARYAEAEIVLDATGAYRTPNGLGPGGVRAVGEEEHAARIEYYVPDVLDGDRDSYAGGRTLVIGSGYSAVTTLRNLQRLRAEEPDTEIAWLRRPGSEPYPLIPDDPLPMRRELSEFGNAVARDEIPDIDVIVGHVREVRDGGDRELSVEVGDSAGAEAHEFDRIVANVGYRPDLEMIRELQVHQCYATEGPIDLAASLLANDSADCLDQETGGGVELLENPEPNFYLVGSKSYGRNSKFLLQDGFEQIRQIFESLE